ncbi:MAG: hypothetical protein IPG04_43445 [Polyangiaceae bacterium]|nr:hypothetical protein [Polyangiaceae bacterium]
MDDLRQIQCVVDACRRLFHLCRDCDRGHIYCVDGRHDDERLARRRALKRVHWRSQGAKVKTSSARADGGRVDDK